MGIYCIHGSKSIDLNESLADIDEFSILFVCLARSVRGGHMLVHEQLMDRSRLIQKYKSGPPVEANKLHAGLVEDAIHFQENVVCQIISQKWHKN